MLQLGVQVPDERPASHNLSMAVIEGQTSVAHVFTIDALCPCGHADDLSLLHVSACTTTCEDISGGVIVHKLLYRDPQISDLQKGKQLSESIERERELSGQTLVILEQKLTWKWGNTLAL